jgi:hypothetical protein
MRWKSWLTTGRTMPGNADQLMAEVFAEQLERVAVANELRGLGINPSPADVSAYYQADPKTRRRLGLQWAVLADEICPVKGET